MGSSAVEASYLFLLDILVGSHMHPILVDLLSELADLTGMHSMSRYLRGSGY
jgi:hypothetical protein